MILQLYMQQVPDHNSDKESLTVRLTDCVPDPVRKSGEFFAYSKQDCA